MIQNNEEDEFDIIKVHGNTPQQMALIYRPRILISILGRGVGKTTGITVYRVWDIINIMPGCLFLLGCDSFKHLTTVILPALFTGLSKYGMEKNVNYWVDEFPPEGIPKPLQVITNPKGFVFFDTGAAMVYVSTNFQSHFNGMSVDAIIWEEAKLLKWDRVKEVNLMNRGQLEYFGDRYCHHSVTVVSDMSDDPEHWMYQYYDRVDAELLQLIASLSYKQWKLRKKLIESKNKRLTKQLESEIEDLEQRLHFFRSKAVMVMEYSSIQNMHVLGYDTIKEFLTNPVSDVMLNVLSIRPTKGLRYYYMYLDREKHGFSGINWDYVQKKNALDKWDYQYTTGDDTNKELVLCFDWNNNVISLAVGQQQTKNGRKRLRLLNIFYSMLGPGQGIQDVVRQFEEFYKARKYKKVTIVYDTTGDFVDASRAVPYWKEARDAFSKDWLVGAQKYKVTSHDERFRMWAEVMNGTGPFGFEFETELCHNFYKAAKAVKRKTSKKWKIVDKRRQKKALVTIIEKDKSSETDKKGTKIPLEEQSHITEAVDGLMVYFFQENTLGQKFNFKIR